MVSSALDVGYLTTISRYPSLPSPDRMSLLTPGEEGAALFQPPEPSRTILNKELSFARHEVASWIAGLLVLKPRKSWENRMCWSQDKKK